MSQQHNRRVRKIVSYACTACYTLFPNKSEATAHYAAKHPQRATKSKTAKPRKTQVGSILEAIRGGASTASAVSRKTRIDLSRTHSLLSYLRRKGRITGMTGNLRLKKA